MMRSAKTTLCVLWCIAGMALIFPQNEMTQRGSIPEELLRPRREESPRYPVDMVIGPLGQGRAAAEAYAIAQSAAAAFLAGDADAPVFSRINKIFLESCMTVLDTINPRYFRLGSGREEPDGSFSFLVRFAGREQGITGELFVRLEERRPLPQAQPAPPPPVDDDPFESEAGFAPDDTGEEVAEAEPEPEPEPLKQEPVYAPPERVWIFEDIILEEARSREVENRESRHRFDFPPYERFF